MVFKAKVNNKNVAEDNVQEPGYERKKGRKKREKEEKRK